MEKETGGPAFPFIDSASPLEHSGMTLRDYFAAKATDEDVRQYINDYSQMVDGFYFSVATGKPEPTKMPTKRTREQAKYIYADAMLKAREQ